MKAWRGFKGETWKTQVNVRDFIVENYKPYDGDDAFLVSASSRTKALYAKVQELFLEEQENKGVRKIDSKTVMRIGAFAPGYIDRDNELIVGLQTDEPLKRGCNPFGGMRMAREACSAYGVTVSPQVEAAFQYHKTHNDGVFSAYTEEIKAARRVGLLTGLPDAYGRGRIIGDYRRVALYGVDYLILEKKEALERQTQSVSMIEADIRMREEVSDQIEALNALKEMARSYGFDLSKPAETACEATQWLYFAYLAANQEQNGAAMSLGRISTFLDIYFSRDLENALLTEEQAQEIMDDLVIKLRMIRHLRTPAYNELFAGDPVWITEAIGGVGEDGRHMVTKTSYRMLHTLYTLGPSAEPNLTVLWSERLPQAFMSYTAKVSCETNAIQYENDDLMRPLYGDDYGIACCVSAMRIGKETQFFGARVNLAKLLLLAINGGKDEISGEPIGPQMPVWEGDYLEIRLLTQRLEEYRRWLAKTYVSAMNIIHYMHDKYAYEKIEMALHDIEVHRYMAFGVAGLSCMVDSLSAATFAQVRCIRDETTGLVVDYSIEGDFPAYGNDDDRVDQIAKSQVTQFLAALQKHPLYRKAEHTLSVLTITSNVMYGKKTGSTPDGRKRGEPLAPGANPMRGRDKSGALASLNSVAKLPYSVCRDGISNTFSITPGSLGKCGEERIMNLTSVLTGYFVQKAHHLNVNVFSREELLAAMQYPERYPNLTIRVSGYAVNFHKLSRLQQLEVISRTFHTAV